MNGLLLTLLLVEIYFISFGESDYAAHLHKHIRHEHKAHHGNLGYGNLGLQAAPAELKPDASELNKPFPRVKFAGYSDLAGNTVHMNCSHFSYPICCAVADYQSDKNYYPNRFPLVASKGLKCTLSKEYISSPYELKHLETIKEYTNLETDDERRAKYLDFFFDDIPHTFVWMDRVKARMDNANMTPTAEDYEYLSRFQTTKKCATQSSSGDAIVSEETWEEFIEPLTAYARHPFGIFGCAWPELLRDNSAYVRHKGRFAHVPYNVSQQSRDYVLLTNYGNVKKAYKGEFPEVSPLQKRYFFDLGSKTVSTSLFWFICGYLQNGLDFDRIYAWEVQKYEHYWQEVPNRIIPFLQFMNTGVATSGTRIQQQETAQQDLEKEHMSIERILSQFIMPDDFVSFKLDIDVSAIEIPVALNLLSARFHSDLLGKDLAFADLIDEFFFELHFKCEFMRTCGWSGIPQAQDGLKLDRYHAIKLFYDLRKLGIRSHFWP
jgi:hypothetical protein